MKYEGTRPSGVDKDIDVYIFSLGKQELELLHAICDRTARYMPMTTETQIAVHRLKTITKEFQKMRRIAKLGKLNPKKK